MTVIRNVIKTTMFLHLIVAIGLMAWSITGCATSERNLLEGDRYGNLSQWESRSLRGNEMAGASGKATASKALSEMTSAELERSGDLLLSRGNLHMAFVRYDRASRLKPDNMRIRYKKGRLLAIGRMNEEAIKEFQEVLKKEPRHALSHEGLGLAFFQMKKYDVAEVCFRAAIELDPKLWKAHNYLGILYDYQKKYNMAVEEYNRALSLKPDDGLLYNNLGVSYSLAGDNQRAVSAFNKAIEANYAESKVYNNLGLALFRLEKEKGALQALTKGGDEARAYNNLGCIYLKQGEFEKAISCFEKAIQVSPGFYYKAGENLKKAGMAHESFFDSNIQSSFDAGIPRKKPRFKKDLDKLRADLVPQTEPTTGLSPRGRVPKVMSHRE